MIKKNDVLLEILIENILDKDKITPFGSNPDLFHREPLWVDFQNRIIVERTEVNDIIEHIEKEQKPLCLVGEPASGKTVIIRNVAYKLANRGWTVFLVQLKKNSLIEFKEKLLEVKGSKTLIIIDDAHLNLTDVDAFVGSIDLSETKLLISTRKYEQGGKDGAIRLENIHTYPEKILRASSISDFIIRKFFTNSTILKKYLATNCVFTESEISRIKTNLTSYKDDLWVLSYALKNYSIKDGISEERIIENIRNDIIDLSVNAGNIILPIAVLYKYEIPVHCSFLVNTLKCNESEIDNLIKKGVLVSDGTFLSLYHSSLADLYIKTFRQYDSGPACLGAEVKAIIQENEKSSDWFSGVFCLYITAMPESTCDVLNGLGRWAPNIIERESRRNQINELFNRNSLQILSGLKLEQDIDKVTRTLWNIKMANENNFNKTIKALEILDLNWKIKAEKDVFIIGNFIWLVGSIELLKYIGLQDFKIKIDEEPDIAKIGRCFWGIISVDLQSAKDLSRIIDLPKLLDKFSFKENTSDVREMNDYYYDEPVEGFDDAINNIDAADDGGNFSRIDRYLIEIKEKFLQEKNFDNLRVKIESENNFEIIISLLDPTRSKIAAFTA